MNRFTSEDLMKAMKLQVGDRVKVKYETLDDSEVYETYEVKHCKDRFYLENDDYQENIGFLVDTDFDIRPRPKRVGDTLCEDCECVECHLRCLPHCNPLVSDKETLFNILDGWNEYDTFDQEIFDLLKIRLNKEME